MASLEQNFPLEHNNPSMRQPRDVADLAKQKEAERKRRSIRGRSFSFPSADLAKQKETERKNESIQVAIEEEESRSDQRVSPDHDAPLGRDGSKIEVWEFRILLANFIVELMSIVFDQLSSQHKPFLLLCLIMSISAVLISILELVYKLIKERDFWKGVTNWGGWLFDPPPGVRVGFFPCITALTCAFGQFIITTVNYSLYRKDGNAPINVSISSTIFAAGQLCSSLSSRGAKTETKPVPMLQPMPTPTPMPTLMLTPTPEPEPMLQPMPTPTPTPTLMLTRTPEPEPIPLLELEEPLPELVAGLRNPKPLDMSELWSLYESMPWLRPLSELRLRPVPKPKSNPKGD